MIVVFYVGTKEMVTPLHQVTNRHLFIVTPNHATITIYSERLVSWTLKMFFLSFRKIKRFISWSINYVLLHYTIVELLSHPFRRSRVLKHTLILAFNIFHNGYTHSMTHSSPLHTDFSPFHEDNENILMMFVKQEYYLSRYEIQDHLLPSDPNLSMLTLK